MRSPRWLCITMIVLGIVLFLGLNIGQLCHCMSMWTAGCKTYAFSSFWEYYISVSKGAVTISFLLSTVLIGFGLLS